MLNKVMLITLGAGALGAAGFMLPQGTVADAPVAYYENGGRAYRVGNQRVVRVIERPRYVTRTIESPVIVEKVVHKPVYVERVIERRVVVHKRSRGIIPKVYSMVFGG